MEADCKDSPSSKMESKSVLDTTQLFATLSSQITTQILKIQEQLRRGDQKLPADFKKVVQDN